MTYFCFLAWFLGVPLLALSLLHWLDERRKRRDLEPLHGRRAWLVVAAHAMVAVAYTTPWDNYLVANGIWSYDQRLVAGLTVGWVPLEEYLIFVLQSLAVGFGLFYAARRMGRSAGEGPTRGLRLRLLAVTAVGTVWAFSLALWVSRWAPATYLALQLIWALPPILLQLTVGGDLLWRHRRLPAITIGTASVYLSVADTLAIGAGTWAISAAHSSLNVLLAGRLPVEEASLLLLDYHAAGLRNGPCPRAGDVGEGAWLSPAAAGIPA